MCYRTGQCTVCRLVHASFSPEIVQAGAVKRVILLAHPRFTYVKTSLPSSLWWNSGKRNLKLYQYHFQFKRNPKLYQYHFQFKRNLRPYQYHFQFKSYTLPAYGTEISRRQINIWQVKQWSKWIHITLNGLLSSTEVVKSRWRGVATVTKQTASLAGSFLSCGSFVW